MSNIDKRALREAADKASTDNHTQDEWFHYLRCSTPETVLALLDELEAKDNRINRLEAIVAVAEQRNALMREWKRALKVPCDLVDDQVPVVIHGMVIRLERLKETEEKLEVVKTRIADLESDNAYIRNRHKELDLLSAPNSRAITQHFDTIALETAREIMCDVNRRHEFLGGEVQLLSRIQCRIDDACRTAMLQGAEPVKTANKLPANTPCKDAPEHIWLQTAGVWPENGEFSELTWCSDNQHPDDTLYVRADVVTGNSPVISDGWKLVPNEPTTKQWAAGMQAFDSGMDKVTRVYKAMIAAAPQQEAKNV